ncbi:MAG: hypothetical protein SGPRY_008679 [Prymnesium sp.]
MGNLKYDFCGLEAVPPAEKQPKLLYQKMKDALNATGRPILYSLCNWGTGAPHMWGQEVANSWRTGRDVFAVWDERAARSELKLPGYLQSVMTAIEDVANLHPHAGPGGFNDPDMLVVGLEGMTPYGLIDSDSMCPSHLRGRCKKGDYISREQWGSVGGLTHTEQRTHFAFWCMLAAPLMLGNDPRRMSVKTVRILTAKGLLAINQDPLGKQAQRIWREGDLAIWRKQLASGEHALLLFNGGNVTTDITTVWNRDLTAASAPHRKKVAREPPCADKEGMEEMCANWAKSGECSKNAGYMMSACPKSCDGCPPARWEGEQATAHVRDAWGEEEEGDFIAMYTAKHVEPHEARVLVVSFGPPSVHGAMPGDVNQTSSRMKRRQQGGEATISSQPKTSRSIVGRSSVGVVSAGRGDGAVRSQRHSVLEQHFHKLPSVSLESCTVEYGPSLLLLFFASMALSFICVHIFRELIWRRRPRQKQPSGVREGMSDRAR